MSTNKSQFHQLGSLFFAARQIIRQRVSPRGRHDQNAWLRLETLRFISHAKNPTMLEVARFAHVTAPSATSLVKNLEKSGLVYRTQSRIDKRIVRIRVTPRGRRAVSSYARRSEAIMRSVFSQLPRRDVRKLAQILQQLKDLHN